MSTCSSSASKIFFSESGNYTNDIIQVIIEKLSFDSLLLCLLAAVVTLVVYWYFLGNRHQLRRRDLEYRLAGAQQEVRDLEDKLVSMEQETVCDENKHVRIWLV